MEFFHLLVALLQPGDDPSLEVLLLQFTVLELYKVFDVLAIVERL